MIFPLLEVIPLESATGKTKPKIKPIKIRILLFIITNENGIKSKMQKTDATIKSNEQIQEFLKRTYIDSDLLEKLSLRDFLDRLGFTFTHRVYVSGWFVT